MENEYRASVHYINAIIAASSAYLGAGGDDFHLSRHLARCYKFANVDAEK